MTRAPAPANGRCCRLDTGCYVPDSLSHWRSLPQFNPLYRDAPESPRDGMRIDLYHFTSLLNRELEEDGRRCVVEMMWEIAYADGHVSEFESNLIWRAADLLGVPSRERIELGRRVASEHGGGQG